MNFAKRAAVRFTAGLLAAITMMTPAIAVTGTVNAEGGLRMRSASSTNAAVLTTLPNGTQVEVAAATENGWYQITYQNTQGYVSGKYLVVAEAEAAAIPAAVEPVYGRVTAGPLNVRSAPSTSGERVKQLSTGSVVEIEGEENGWYKIASGYVSAEYVKKITAEEATATSQVVEYAKQFLGYPYVYGGSSTKGFDCSGFTKYVFQNFGITLNRTASAQMDNGVAVSMSELIPGDVVFFKKPGSSASRASHVGIYIGNNQFIHASTSSTGVIISDMDYAYYTTGFVGGRRML